MDFSRFFELATGHTPRPWQVALAEAHAPGHRVIRIPTGFGKTLGVAAAWLFHRVQRRDPRWPARLIWMLPMRTLVEQTEGECRGMLTRLGLLWEGTEPRCERVGVHVLMGGADAGPFHLHPSAPAILIGTQDMLLSRALNRGYGAGRARWPIDFGLVSQDGLWVLDEVQLMGVGLATALQLAVFRDRLPGLRTTCTWAMSATLPDGWLTKSPDTAALNTDAVRTSLLPEDELQPLWAESSKPVELRPAVPAKALALRMAESAWIEHATLTGLAPLTLAICNTVERARELFDALVKRARGTNIAVDLVHSRFRGAERRAWTGRLLSRDENATPASRILVATQVVEAGVDLSADLLVTELCPWPSFVQRVGRLARRGGRGRVLVQDLEEKASGPYDPDAMSAARSAIAGLANVADASSRGLRAYEEAHPDLVDALYPFDPPHLLLQEEIEELFDTTTDLSGGDLDVSRYIREGDERDLSVAWVPVPRDDRGRPVAPARDLRPGRDALCAVPFLKARDWLCGPKSAKSEPRRLRKGTVAFVWDYLEGRWRAPERSDLRPGVTVLVDASVGGYDPDRGFDPASKASVGPVPLLQADLQEQTESAQDCDELSLAAWQTIAFHGASVERQVDQLLAGLPLADSRLRTLIGLAARWHDVGKAHPAFQAAIRTAERPDRPDLAKAPATAWARGRVPYVMPGTTDHPAESRPGLRHELASLLALFDVLRRWAPPGHPSRLGPWADALPAEPARGRPPAGPSAVEQEILDLSAAEFDLVAYLVCSHHGKLRARLHAAAADQSAAIRGGALPIRGVYEGDALPEIQLTGADGCLHQLPESQLTLEPAALGLSPQTGRSWTERVEGLRARFGPFALAYLEALLRAADVRASKDVSLVDPALAGHGSSTIDAETTS